MALYLGKDRIAGQGGSDITVVDNLTSSDATAALSAKQGKELSAKIAELEAIIGDINSILATLTTV